MQRPFLDDEGRGLNAVWCRGGMQPINDRVRTCVTGRRDCPPSEQPAHLVVPQTEHASELSAIGSPTP